MLSWLSGAPPTDQQAEYADSSVMHSQPDTPAHVFAARAFKYRLWGTPKPASNPPKARTDRLRALQTRSDEFLSSPSKPNGILLTSGASNLRRSKTVTFPAQYNDERKKDGLQPQGNALRGFPPPNKADIAGMELPELTGKQSAFTERLQSARSSKTEDKLTTSKPITALFEPKKVTQSLTTASDTSDWKSRYEQYAARTEREMRKLITKQQAAKHYAREADAKATSLAEQLASEQQRAQTLEARVEALTADLARLHTQLARPQRSVEERFAAIRISPARRSSPREDTWVAALEPSTPSRTPLEAKRTSERRTTGRTPRISRDGLQDKENTAPAYEGTSPRKTLDAERRAAAAARIAARRREKALARA